MDISLLDVGIRISGLAGLSLSLASSYVLCDRKLFTFNLLGNVGWALNGLLLGSLTAFWVCILICITSYIRLTSKDKYFLPAYLAGLLGLSVIAYFSWVGVNSLPSLIACASLMYVTLLAKGLTLRLGLFIVVIAFFTHGWIYGAYEQMATNVVVGLILMRTTYVLIKNKNALPV